MADGYRIQVNGKELTITQGGRAIHVTDVNDPNAPISVVETNAPSARALSAEEAARLRQDLKLDYREADPAEAPDAGWKQFNAVFDRSTARTPK